MSDTIQLVRRILNVLTLLSGLLLFCAIGCSIFAHFQGIQIGRVTTDVDQYGTTYTERYGIFFGGGRLALSRGTLIEYPFQGPRKLLSHESRTGIFAGDFAIWDGYYDNFPLGFGHASILTTTTVGWPATLADLKTVSTHTAVWIGAFAALPCWWWVARRYKLGPSTVAWVPATYLALGIFSAAAIAVPALAKLMLLYLLGTAGWRAGRLLWTRRSNARMGRCRVCGYDLRATPDPEGPLLDRCPECGTHRIQYEPVDPSRREQA